MGFLAEGTLYVLGSSNCLRVRVQGFIRVQGGFRACRSQIQPPLRADLHGKLQASRQQTSTVARRGGYWTFAPTGMVHPVASCRAVWLCSSGVTQS